MMTRMSHHTVRQSADEALTVWTEDRSVYLYLLFIENSSCKQFSPQYIFRLSRPDPDQRHDVTWNSPDPKFTSCFEKTILIWFPCLYLWIFTPLEIFYLRRTVASEICFNFYNISKLVLISLLGVTSLVDIAYYVFFDSVRYSVDIHTPVIKWLTFCLFFALTYANIKCGVRSSGVLFIFSFLLAFCGAPQFRSVLKANFYGSTVNDVNLEMVNSVSYLMYYPLVVIVFLLNCFADACPTGLNQSIGKNPCPENASSFLSKILFSWFDKFAWRSYKNPLKDEDIWDLDYEMQTTRIVQSFESKWHRTLHRLQKSGGIRMRYENEKLLENGAADRSNMGVEYINSCSKKASILYPMFEVFGASFMFGVILKLFHSGLNFASPQILNLILAFVASENKEFVWRGFFYVFLLLVVAILQMLLLNYHFHIMFRIGLRIRTALVSAIYKKALKISNGARRDFAFGEIVNLMSVDAQRFVQMLIFIPLLWVSPAEVCLSFYCLWNILGPSILVGLAILILLMVVAGWIISKIQKLQVKQMKYKDKRVKLTNEILSGIKVLKLYACEPSFERYVNEIRSEEIKILKNTGYLHAGSSFAWICTPFLVSFVTFGVYVLSDEKNVLDAQIAFVSLSLFNVMKFSMELLPIVVKEMVQTSVAVKRINKFLNSEELDPNAVSHEQRYEPIVIEDGNFSWEDYKSQPILSNINVTVNSGDLVAIVGAVGSGKSSLLSAILGEMYKQSGYVNTTGTLAYVPQQAWIQNATLRNNITFGDKVKSSFYDSVIEACALIPDLEILPGGDQTEIGEKGINVSGGQKQRISLARAVYSGADVYLLDDPLSAVDAHVGKHIFEKVIGPNGLLKKKTRVFVTHNVSYLPQVDHIIVLQNGIISETGTYAELLKKGGDFATFLLAYTKENEADELTQSAHATHAHKDVTEQKLEIRRENDNDEKVPKRHKKVSESEQRQETVKAVPDNLIAEEGIQTGNVKWEVYTYYLRAVGSFMVCVTILTNLLYQVFAASSDYWLSAWSSHAKTLSTMTDDRMAQQYKYLVVYALFGLGQAVSVMTQTVALYVGMLRAAKYIHNCLLISVLHWPVVTFDKIPYGRIINRFGFDVDVLDNTLPANMLELLLYTAIVMSNLFVISYNTPLIITVFLPVAALYYFLQRVYVATSKQLKRLESASKSPIYSHFGDSITGAQSIRAYGLQTKFIKTSEIKVDFNLKSSYAGMLVQRWLQVRLDLLGAVIVFSAALFAVLGRNIIGPALVGLSVTYALQVTGNLHWWIRMISEVETNVVAVERIKEYSEMAEEAAWILPNDESVPENWPCKGQITFTNFQVRYHETLEPVLKGINFSVNGGQKVGIVGRTGAGKSSLTLSLFRIIESSGGRILIDDVDISKIGLHTLRGRLTIIPQDPVLFSGTVRMNLDPAAAYSDDSVWRTLELTNLKTYVSSLSGGLQYLVEEGGSNFSIGQRQLICLARALLRKTKVLILDEATAAVDFETDDLIQATIRKEFRDCTVLTIAHRLNTILDYDRIMVLDKGHVAEFDSPSVLLQSKQSIFYSMAKDAKLV